ncbi:MAG: hypothetical protein M1829_002281 [Trizodia sp. TS-e1964]|nr:MAG: hypothetical protein M1829_002281 [Trizodia sp. TS-e1964]
MAGMEQLEIHSKSYLVRWVNVTGGHTISWSINPHKKSINFGIFRHPRSGKGNSNAPTPNLTSPSMFEPPPMPNGEPANPSSRRIPSLSRNDNSTAPAQLLSKGLTSILWVGKCEADKVSMGKYDVPESQGGMYALVFDNTFSKQVSKTATFVLLTYPTDTPPLSSHHVHHFQAGGSALASTTSLGKPSPGLGLQYEGSSDSVHESQKDSIATSYSARPGSSRNSDVQSVLSNFITGVLHKRRRKRHQGFARRFFSLDFNSSTLSYYHNRDSSALRGAIPLSLAVIAANEQNREISVDSGAEVWHLRASTNKEFDTWRAALERASRQPTDVSTPLEVANISQQDSGLPIAHSQLPEDREWARIEALVGRVVGTRDAVRRLATNTVPTKPTPFSTLSSSQSGSPIEPGDSFKDRDKKQFWKRKPSGTGQTSPGYFQPRSVSGKLTLPIPNPLASPTNSLAPPLPRSLGQGLESGMHGHCLELLHDLDSVISDFGALITESKRRRIPFQPPAPGRRSMDSGSEEEFFDAEGGDINDSQLLVIRQDSDDEGHASDDEYEDDSASGSDIDTGGSFDTKRAANDGGASPFPPKPKSLAPLPLPPVKRRNTVPAATVLPPSLIGFLRKNVGKDLSTISMPVSANEPISLLQRISEQMEYSQLLDKAAMFSSGSTEGLLYITAFAIAAFSNIRVKERAIRKPFNPMLGETFELVREDRGFRFLAEKVSHRPVRMACQADGKDWSFSQSPLPTQKFWGKSAELNTEGRIRVILHSNGDCFSWNSATCFLRNIIAGEKYVEPVGTMTIVNETTGDKAIVTFKAKGMFSGRSEDVAVHAASKDGTALPLGLTGKWTTSLTITERNAETTPVWTAGPLVDNAPQRYGFTAFAASLNEVTAVERGQLPPTDSRLRPDQRAAEFGDLDAAELVKAQLEERQRVRRRKLDERGEEWVPRWFARGGDEESWRLKGGREGYWEERARGAWEGLVNVFELA